MAKGAFVKSLIEMAEKAGLDMSDAARMQRAKDMGFHENTLYHGTSTSKSGGELFDEFQKFEGQDMSRSVSRSPVGKLGISLGEQPQIADDFSRQASPVGGEGAAIMPTRFRSDKTARIDLEGSETNDEIYGAVVDAWSQGFDAIQFTNYTTPAGTKGSFVLVKEPNQIRSVNAAFDPKKKDSANILAASVPVATAGMLFGKSDKASAAPESMSSRINQMIEARSDDVGSIQAPINNRASNAAALAGQYNSFRRDRMHPLLDALLPFGELPEELWTKRAYGDNITKRDYVNAGLGML